MAWYTQGLQINPGINAILADTGPSVGGDTRGEARVVISSTVATSIIVEHMDATNQVALHSHSFFIVANGMMNPVFLVDLAQGERLRIRCPVALLGQAQGSILSNVHVGGPVS